MKAHKYQYFLAFTLLLAFKSVFAQANANPCDLPNINCSNGGANGIIISLNKDTFEYSSPGRSMPFWVAIGDTLTGDIDNSQTTSFTITKQSGPGEILGSLGSSIGSYVYYNDLKFTVTGNYIIQITANNGQGWVKTIVVSVLPEVSMCADAPSGQCGSFSGNEIIAVPQHSNVIPVDAVLPIRVGTVDSISGDLDTTFSGTIYVEKLFGPGNLYGSLSMTGQRWFEFSNLKFDAEGLYTIRFYEQSEIKYEDAELEIEVVKTTSGFEIVSIKNVSVFPNPINNFMKISSDKDLKGETIEIYNNVGQLVLTKNITQTSNHLTLSTATLKEGVYLVKLSSSGRTIKVVK